jgi:hypothetical protein
MSAIGTERTCCTPREMSAFGGKADIVQGKADIKKCPLMTQSGHWSEFNPGRSLRRLESLRCPSLEQGRRQ